MTSILPFIFFASTLFIASGCTATRIETTTASLGRSIDMTEMLKIAHQPGPIVWKKHLAARWSVPLSGLLNLDHPRALAAGLTDQETPIEIYVYSILHPSYGHFIVDSGVSANFDNPAENDDLASLVKMAMNTDALKLLKSTAAVEQEYGDIQGVFLTHIHLDHIMGGKDLQPQTPVYVGHGDVQLRSFSNLFTQGTTDRLLGDQTILNEWVYEDDKPIDIFGDGSVFAIPAPGHTPGSTVYLVRTTQGPQLMVGDVSHTKWGWENAVEPGTYSEDQDLSAVSLQKMIQLASQIENVKVHPGHQSLEVVTNTKEVE